MVLPISPIPGVATTIADAMGREVAARLRDAGFDVEGADVAAAALPADCRPETSSPPGSPGRQRSANFPGCACGVAQSRGAQLVVVGRLSRLTTKMTLTLVAYASATCAPLSAEGSASDEIAATKAAPVAEAATRALVDQMSGTLAVTSTPAEAEIWVGGESRGTGSVELRLLEGHYEVEGRLDGWTPAHETADVSVGQRAQLALTLTKIQDDGGTPPPPNGHSTPARPPWQTPAAIGALSLGGLLGVLVVANATQIDDAHEPGALFWGAAGAAVVLVGAGVVLFLADLGGTSE